MQNENLEYFFNNGGLNDPECNTNNLNNSVQRWWVVVTLSGSFSFSREKSLKIFKLILRKHSVSTGLFMTSYQIFLGEKTEDQLGFCLPPGDVLLMTETPVEVLNYWLDLWKWISVTPRFQHVKDKGKAVRTTELNLFRKYSFKNSIIFLFRIRASHPMRLQVADRGLTHQLRCQGRWKIKYHSRIRTH